MEFNHHNFSKPGVEKTKSGESENPKDVDKNAARSAKESTSSDLNISEMDMGYSQNPERSFIKIGSPGNRVKESTSQSDFGESVICETEFGRNEIPLQLSSSIGSYGNESGEIVLLDFSVSEIGETDSEKCENTTNHFNLETLESFSKTGTKPAEVSLNGQFSTPSTCKNSRVFSRRSSIFKQFDPLRPDVLQKSSGCCSTDVGSLSVGGNDFFSCNNSSDNFFTNPSEDSLIYFESMTPLTPRVLFPSCTESPKKYTEDELQKALKDQESRLTIEHVKKYIQKEFKFIKQSSEPKRQLLNKVTMCKCYSAIVSEMLKVRENLNNSCKETEDKITSVKEECAWLESDKNMCKEDLNEYENAFSEIHKRYEQIKSALETCKKNRSILTENVDSARALVDGQSNMNSILKSRMKGIMEKAEKEIDFAKKSSETQIAILKAKIMKAEMKICSLESTLEQAQSENKEHVSLYDYLMSKLNA